MLEGRTKKLNRKGFTLIELLAVISILAILMLLASGSVISMLTDAQKNAFSIDAQNVLDQAKIQYTQAIFNGDVVGSHFCMPISYLRAHGLSKVNDKFNGSVEVNVTGDVATYRIWLTDGQHRFNGVEYTKLNKDNVEDSAEAVSLTCEGAGTLLS